MYYVYVLQSKDTDLYFGSTNDLKRRLKEHRENKMRATRNKEWELVYYEAYKSESDARRREQNIKFHGQAAAQLKGRIRESRQTEC